MIDQDNPDRLSPLAMMLDAWVDAYQCDPPELDKPCARSNTARRQHEHELALWREQRASHIEEMRDEMIAVLKRLANADAFTTEWLNAATFDLLEEADND